MSRDARKALTTLESISGKKASIEDAFIAEELCYSFYPSFIISIIRKVYNPNSKLDPGRMSFYVKPIRSQGGKGKAKGVRRDTRDWIMTDNDRRVYWAIGHYLLTDYSHEHLQLVRECCRYPFEDVKKAIAISEEEGVHSVPYLHSVLERIQAEREREKQKIAELRKMVINNVGEEQVIKRNNLEIASLMYEWEQTIQNMNLRRKVEKLFGPLKEE